MIDRSIFITEEEAQGEYGERLVNSFFEKNKFIVESNPDKYGTWDTRITENIEDALPQTIQIKTCTRFVTKRSFRFHIGYTGKAFETIKSCDHLICVIRNPPTMFDHEYGGSIVKILDHKKYKMSRDKNLWIPSNKDTTKILHWISPEELTELDSFKT
jgi:hypothetical protein